MTRTKEIAQPIPVTTKVLYGIGMASEGIKVNAFNLFLLFFYQQVVGLDPLLCGLALVNAVGETGLSSAEEKNNED